MTEAVRSFDVHVHFVPASVQRRAGEEWLPALHWESGRQVMEYGGHSVRAVTREFADLSGLLRDSGAMGLDRLLLSPWANLLADNFDGQKALKVAGLQNEGMQAAAEECPERLFSLGTVCMRQPEVAARQLEELIRHPLLAGVEISTTIAGRLLGDQFFLPFWEAAEATQALVFVHPSQLGFGLEALQRHRLWNLVGNPSETAFTAADMVLAGVLERFPNLKVVLAHAGGSFLAMRGRVAHGWRVAEEVRRDLASRPDRSFARFHFDTIAHDATMLRRLIEFAGPGHVLLGSDYPFDMAPEDPVGDLLKMNLGEDATQRILLGNALRLTGSG